LDRFFSIDFNLKSGIIEQNNWSISVMARKKEIAEDDIFSQLASETGGEVVGEGEKASKYFIDTGNLAINYCCSGKFMTGGIPGGRLTEIYGPSASSKSLLGTNLLFGCQKLGGVPILIDSENAINKDFIKKASHADLNKIVRYTPETLEKCFHVMYRAIEVVRSNKKYEDKPIVIVYDSISVSPCGREFRETELPDDFTKEQFKKIVGGNEQPGERAKICSKELRKLNTVMEENNVSVVIMNQIRDKIGVLYGSPETTAGGGNALPFYASLRFRTQTQKKIEQKVQGLAKKKTIGINIKIQNKKNRSVRPFIEVENIPLFFETGINPLGGLLGALLDADRIIASGAGNFKVKPEYADGRDDVKFKSSMERNDVPIDILLECPALIDGVTKEDVLAYLEPFREAIRASDSPDVEAFDVGDSGDDEIDNILG
jgi:recombination protein RecA